MIEKEVKKENVNFKKVEVGGVLKTNLSIAFNDSMFEGKRYCQKQGLDYDIFRQVLAGKSTGKKFSPRGGKARKVILQLKEDGIWVGGLTWEV